MSAFRAKCFACARRRFAPVEVSFPNERHTQSSPRRSIVFAGEFLFLVLRCLLSICAQMQNTKAPASREADERALRDAHASPARHQTTTSKCSANLARTHDEARRAAAALCCWRCLAGLLCCAHSSPHKLNEKSASPSCDSRNLCLSFDLIFK